MIHVRAVSSDQSSARTGSPSPDTAGVGSSVGETSAAGLGNGKPRDDVYCWMANSTNDRLTGIACRGQRSCFD
jgi:hypothetical protein